MKIAKKITAGVCIALAVLVAACGSSPKASVAPDELDAAIRAASDYLDSNVPAGNKIVILNVQSDSAALSDYIIDELIANAVNDKNFPVVDRQQLDAIRSELDFQWAGEVDDNSAQEIGKMVGAQTIVSGAISKVGDNYRMRIRALEVQTAQVQGQFNRNIPAGATITALLNSSSQGYGSGSGASGGRAGTQTAQGGKPGGGSGTSGGGQTQAPAKAAAPPAQAVPTGPLTDGTYTFWPRIQVRQAGVRKNLYLDRILVDGQYFTMFFTGGPSGRAGDGDYHPFWDQWDKISLQNLDGSGRPFNPMNQGEDNTDPNNTDGFFITFQRVTGRRFSLTSTDINPPYVFAEIILGEPDA